MEVVVLGMTMFVGSPVRRSWWSFFSTIVPLWISCLLSILGGKKGIMWMVECVQFVLLKEGGLAHLKRTKTLPVQKTRLNWIDLLCKMYLALAGGRTEPLENFPLFFKTPVMLRPNPLSWFNVFFFLFFLLFLFIAPLELLSRFTSHFAFLCSSFHSDHILLLYLLSPSSSLATHYLSTLLPEYSHPCLSALPHVFHFFFPSFCSPAQLLSEALLPVNPPRLKKETALF